MGIPARHGRRLYQRRDSAGGRYCDLGEAVKTILALIIVCLALPVFALESDTKAVCHAINDPDSFIKSAATKSAAMTIVRAAEFGKAAGYEPPLVAVFVMPDDNTLVVVSRQPKGFAECFTSVHEDSETWEAVQKFFGRGA